MEKKMANLATMTADDRMAVMVLVKVCPPTMVVYLVLQQTNLFVVSQ
jgi:hypothetical protein